MNETMFTNELEKQGKSAYALLTSEEVTINQLYSQWDILFLWELIEDFSTSYTSYWKLVALMQFRVCLETASEERTLAEGEFSYNWTERLGYPFNQCSVYFPVTYNGP